MGIHYSVSITLNEAQTDRLHQLVDQSQVEDEGQLIMRALEAYDRLQLPGDVPSVFSDEDES